MPSSTRLLRSLFSLCLLSGTVVHAQAGITEPASGSPLRKAVLDGLRPVIEKKFGAEVQFVVKTLRVSPQWAFVEAEPRRKDGTPFDAKKIFGDELEHMDGIGVGAILELVGDAWQLRDRAIGPTDVWWLNWCEKVPLELIQGCPPSAKATLLQQPAPPTMNPTINKARAQAEESTPPARQMTAQDSANAASLTPWQDVRDKNAAAVVSLIAAAKSNAVVGSAFAACVAHHGDMFVAGANQVAEQVRRESESKAQIQANDALLRVSIRQRLIAGEGACAWKIVAWASGMMSFDPTQFTPDKSLGQLGTAMALSKLYRFERRVAGETIGVFTPTSVACATTQATAANDALRSPDLTSRAYERLARLLATDIPPEASEFGARALLGFAFPRFSLDDLLVEFAAK